MVEFSSYILGYERESVKIHNQIEKPTGDLDNVVTVPFSKILIIMTLEMAMEMMISILCALHAGFRHGSLYTARFQGLN